MGLLLADHASTIQDVPNQRVTRGAPAVFPWSVTLDAGITIVTVQWVKMPTSQLAVRTGSTFTVSSIYTGRVTNPSEENIILRNVTDADAGTYQCTVTLSDLTAVEDSADLVVVEVGPSGLVIGCAVGVSAAAAVVAVIVAVVLWKKNTRAETCWDSASSPSIWIRCGRRIPKCVGRVA
ncbi:hypothetical protein Bbelb_248110 [Branchiostoma belcheri]|nr:hypothetical protein Bbelb_248110 [Branchiostoma belcheri]